VPGKTFCRRAHIFGIRVSFPTFFFLSPFSFQKKKKKKDEKERWEKKNTDATSGLAVIEIRKQITNPCQAEQK